MKTQNPVLEELHAARSKILADWNGDTQAYLRDAQARLEQSGKPIWQGKQRTMHCTEVVGFTALDSPKKIQSGSAFYRTVLLGFITPFLRRRHPVTS